MSALVLALNLGGNEVPWTDPIILTILPLSVVLFVLFLVVEGNYAEEPIMPLYFLTKRTPLAAGIVLPSHRLVLIVVELVYSHGRILSDVQPSAILPSRIGPSCGKSWFQTSSAFCRHINGVPRLWHAQRKKGATS